ncbi:MAG: AMP-binding protein, partial [Thermoleophilia bacterium]|nr:AMP-binding protein [Thermoleophilia bacterium]
PDTWRLGREQLGLPLGTYYGLTENDGRGTIALDVADYRAGFVGRGYTPQDGVRVVKDGDPLTAGEVGEIELRSESAMTGYFRDEEATARTLRDGWVATGDLGYVDERGDLIFTGRLKNMIKRSGENVSAEEVELTLLEHPAVRDVTVLAVPDRVREEEVKAIVVLEPGAEAAPAALRAFCAAALASFKAPRYVQFADDLPRTVSGKPDVGVMRRTMATPAGCWDSETHKEG